MGKCELRHLKRVPLRTQLRDDQTNTRNTGKTILTSETHREDRANTQRTERKTQKTPKYTQKNDHHEPNLT